MKNSYEIMHEFRDKVGRLVLFRCPRPLNRGVRLIKVSFKVNEGNKFGDFGYCPLNRGCPLNTGFTVLISFILIMMSVQNVDKHLEIIRTCCRVCAKKLGKGTRKTKC